MYRVFLSSGAACLLLCAQAQAALQIGSFETAQSVTASGAAGSSAGSSIAEPNDIGGRRDLFVRLTNPGNITLAAAPFGTPGLFLGSPFGSRGVGTVTWDGGTDPNVLGFGLGNVDLTAGGNAKFTFNIGSNVSGGILRLRVYTDATHWSIATWAIPSTGSTFTTMTASIAFAAFVAGSGAAGAADFTQVNAIQLEIDNGPSAASIFIENLDAVAIPEAAGLATWSVLGLSALALARFRRTAR